LGLFAATSLSLVLFITNTRFLRKEIPFSALPLKEIEVQFQIPNISEQQGGITAVETGKVFASKIEAAFKANGLAQYNFSEYNDNPELFKDKSKFVLQKPPYTNIYNGDGYSDYLLVIHDRAIKVRLEVIWQQVRGSTDQRLAYFLKNAQEAYPENNVLFVIDGPGWREGAVEWMRREAENYPLKNIGVMNLSQFLAWLPTVQ
jgi:hypothetical protein